MKLEKKSKYFHAIELKILGEKIIYEWIRHSCPINTVFLATANFIIK